MAGLRRGQEVGNLTIRDSSVVEKVIEVRQDLENQGGVGDSTDLMNKGSINSHYVPHQRLL